jgi:hypothetical protein
MILPPMKYSVRLKPGHGEKMAQSLLRMVGVVSELDDIIPPLDKGDDSA